MKYTSFLPLCTPVSAVTGKEVRSRDYVGIAKADHLFVYHQLYLLFGYGLFYTQIVKRVNLPFFSF